MSCVRGPASTPKPAAKFLTSGAAELAVELSSIDPRDSEAALLMFDWLTKTGRLQTIGNLSGGGYLLHYSEPKGTTKAGYTPGGTQGGRMVDAALEKATEAGAVPVKRGICGNCYSAVKIVDDVVVSDSDDSPECSAGGAHEFVG